MRKSPRILHGTANIAGIPSCLALAARRLGLEAASYSIYPHPFRYRVDYEVGYEPGRKRRILWNAVRFAWRYDVFHFHFGQSLLGPEMQDVPVLDALGKQVYFHFHGCDLKDSKVNVARHEFTACKHCWPMSCSDNRDLAVRLAQRHARAVFVTTPDLLEFFEGAVWLPQSVDFAALDRRITPLLRATEPRDRDRVRIVHSPSDRIIKGTRYVVEAVESLRSDGYPVELQLIENMPYEQALAACADADIAVDQMLIGWYGTYAVEMMAMRKPVVCYLREDLVARTSDPPPIAIADPRTLRDVLVELLEHRRRWKEIGDRGRDWVLRHHDALTHAAFLADFYGDAETPAPERLAGVACPPGPSPTDRLQARAL